MSSKDGAARFQCPQCGSMVEELIDGTCLRCFVNTRQVLRASPFQITICTRCLRYKHANYWRQGGSDLPSTIIKAAKDELPSKIKLVEPLADAKLERAGKTSKPALLRLWLERPSISKKTVALEIWAQVGPMGSGGESVRACVRPTIPLKKTVCRSCELRDSEYFACSLQLRADGRELKGPELDSITSFIHERSKASQRGPMTFVTRIEDTKEGRDFYLGSTSWGREIARQIVRQRGGIIQESRKLVGVEKGTNKRLYKFTILVRLPRLRPGDITEYKGRIHSVLRIRGTETTLVGLEGRTVRVEGRAARMLPLLARCEETGDALVLQVRPEGIQILDPKSNSTFDLMERPKEIESGGTVRVMWTEGTPRLVPSVGTVADTCQE